MVETQWASIGSLAGPRGLVGGPFGSNLGGKDYVPLGVPVIRGQNLTRGKFVGFNDCVYVTDEKVARDLKNNLAKPGDLIFTQRGTLGQLAIMPPSGHERAVISQSQMRLRVDPEIASATYVYYACSSQMFNNEIRTNAIVTGVPHINLGILGKLEIPLPPLDEQRRIAEVLGALDDLIDTNERLADQLMELARTLTRGAAESVVPLIELAEIAPFRTVTPIGETAHYSLPAFDNGAMPECLDGGGIKSNKILIESSVTLISRLNPHIPRVWAVYPDADVMNVASTEFVPVRGVGVSTEEVYALVSSDAYLAQLSSRVTGTTGSHQRVDKRALLDLTVPDLRLLQPEVREAIREVVQEAHASRVICAKLRRTRDELLPLLMSGKVRARPEGVSA